jgi:hypothetical protein
MYLDYQPMLLENILGDQKLYRVSAYRPRFGPLDDDPRS